MADVFTKAKRSDVMSRIRSRGNAKTELRLLAILRLGGITGWRRHVNLVGRPDFVFRKERLAVFVDGCFWHNCPKHGTFPATRPVFWLKKLEANKARARRVNRTLRKEGWRVLRIWEHDLPSRGDIWAARIVKLLADS